MLAVGPGRIVLEIVGPRTIAHTCRLSRGVAEDQKRQVYFTKPV